jgi:hypothetical protein
MSGDQTGLYEMVFGSTLSPVLSVSNVISGCTPIRSGTPKVPSPRFTYKAAFLPFPFSPGLFPVLRTSVLVYVQEAQKVLGDPSGFTNSEKVRRERRWTSAGATPARELVRSPR